MGLTTNFSLPYPEGSDQPQVHLDVRALAENTDLALESIEPKAWVPFTPTWQQAGGATLAIGNGTLTGRYQSDGKTCRIRVELVRGSTTNVGSANYQWVLPGGVPLPRAFRVAGVGAVYLASGAQVPLTPLFINGTTFVAQRTVLEERIGSVGVGAAWVAGDAIVMDLQYEIA